MNVADFDINQCMPKQPNLVDFLYVVDILWNYEMSNAWFQESSDGNYGMMVHVYFHKLWFIVSGIS